ncbi:MAG: FecR domain-containing protein, partial [bacterium]
IQKDINIFELEQGELFAVVNKQRPDQIFMVKTPTSVCEIVGTQFLLRVIKDTKENITTFLEVFEGEVKIRDKFKSQTNVKSVSVYNSSSCGTMAAQNQKEIVRLSAKLSRHIGVESKLLRKNHIGKLTEQVKSAAMPDHDSDQALHEPAVQKSIGDLLETGNYNECLEQLRHIFSNTGLSGNQHHMHLKTLQAKFREIGDYKRLIQVLELLEFTGSDLEKQNSIISRASIYWENLDNLPAAANLYKSYLTAFNGGIFENEVMLNLAEISESQGRYNEAFKAYLNYFEKYKTEYFAEKALYKSATIARDKLNDNYRAAQLYKTYLNGFKNNINSENALYWLIVCYSGMGDFPKAEEYISLYTAKYANGQWHKEIKQIQKDMFK